MFSPRYGPLFILIAGIALVPTLIHTYVGVSSDDGRSVAKISRSLMGLRSEPTSRKATWVEKTFQSRDWIERQYWKMGNEPLLLFVARSYDPKRLYHHPELALVHGSDLETLGSFPVPENPERRIHQLRGKLDNQNERVVYALLYEDRFVDDPIRFQLSHAWRALFQSRKQMTLFFVHDAFSSPDLPIERSRAVQLLNRAVDRFLSQTPAEAGCGRNTRSTQEDAGC